LRIEEELNCTGLAFASQPSKVEDDPYSSEDDDSHPDSSINGDASSHEVDKNF